MNWMGSDEHFYISETWPWQNEAKRTRSQRDTERKLKESDSIVCGQKLFRKQGQRLHDISSLWIRTLFKQRPAGESCSEVAASVHMVLHRVSSRWDIKVLEVLERVMKRTGENTRCRITSELPNVITSCLSFTWGAVGPHLSWAELRGNFQPPGVSETPSSPHHTNPHMCSVWRESICSFGTFSNVSRVPACLNVAKSENLSRMSCVLSMPGISAPVRQTGKGDCCWRTLVDLPLLHTHSAKLHHQHKPGQQHSALATADIFQSCECFQRARRTHSSFSSTDRDVIKGLCLCARTH